MNDPISILYPDLVTSGQIEPDASQVASQTDAGDFYKDSSESTPGNPYSLDSGSTFDNMYGSSNSVELSDTTDLNIIYSDSTQQENLRKNLGHMAGEIGIDQAGVETFVNITNEYLLSSEKPDPQSTMRHLHREHGKSLHDKLSSAQALIQSLPDLADYLDETGLGNDPKFINQVFKAAESPRALERLKQLNLRGVKL